MKRIPDEIRVLNDNSMSDSQARAIFGESADWIMRRGKMIGCFEEWERWACYGLEYDVNIKTRHVYLNGKRVGEPSRLGGSLPRIDLDTMTIEECEEIDRDMSSGE